MIGGLYYGQNELAGQTRLIQNVALTLSEVITLGDDKKTKQNGVDVAYNRKYVDQPGDYLPKYDPTPDTP